MFSKYDVYTTVQSMYCYPDTDVLINKLNIHDKAELKQAALQLQKAVIEREYAAYIEDKAAERGLECTAQVTCRETDGLLLPWAAAVSGSLPVEEERWLVRTISADLGVPLERQQYEHKEAQP